MFNLKIQNRKKGFTLFVSMIVASLLLAVGFSIGNIILKQLLLSGSGKDSQIAFYAADSGAECAQFWDTKDFQGNPLTEEGPFATSTTITNYAIRCGDGIVFTERNATDDVSATSTIVISYSGTGLYKSCARVQIIKGFSLNTSSESIPYTKIISRGYNAPMSNNTCDTSNPRVVERGVVVQY